MSQNLSKRSSFPKLEHSPKSWSFVFSRQLFSQPPTPSQETLHIFTRNKEGFLQNSRRIESGSSAQSPAAIDVRSSLQNVVQTIEVGQDVCLEVICLCRPIDIPTARTPMQLGRSEVGLLKVIVVKAVQAEVACFSCTVWPVHLMLRNSSQCLSVQPILVLV